MQLDNSDVLFTCRLLSFDQPCGVVDAHDEASGDFGVESSRVARLVDLEDFLDPGDDLMGARVRWLVQVDDTVGLEYVDGAIRWGVATRKGREVARFDVKLVEILYKSRRENHI